MAGGARGYRADVKNNDSNVVTGGLGCALTVCISI